LDDADEQTRLGLCASAFFEEVSTHVLAAMLEIPESEAEALLESAFEQSFGYWEDDAGVRWYRHQGLLREELQLRANHVMNGEQLRGMHERAAHAFRATRPRLAKEAAVHAESWELLSDLLVKD